MELSPITAHKSKYKVTAAQLSKLVENRNVSEYRALGATSGIANSLNVDLKFGICPPNDYVSPNQSRIDDLQLAQSQKFRFFGRQNNNNHHVLLKEEANEDDDHREVQRSGVVVAPSIVTELPSSKVNTCSLEDMDERLKMFGENWLLEMKSKSILELMWDALHDKTLIFLTCAAFVSLAIGIYEDFGIHKDDTKEKIKWVEGVAIIIAVLIVVLVASVNDWQKERQFRALSKRADDRMVKVLRSATPTLISVYDLLVGDILFLEPGDILPADCGYLSGHGICCDESAATGETDMIKKGMDKDVFLISGSKVQEGTGQCLVLAVGPNSFHGRTMMSMRTEDSETPLQMKLNVLAESIAKLGGAASLIMLTVLILKYIVTQSLNGGFNVNSPNFQSVPKIIESVTQIIITTITVLVVAVPEGLPLAVTLSLAFATKKMLADNNLVRVLASCEVMGNATTICSDKTGTLTQNKMTVVKAQIGMRLTKELKVGTASKEDPLQISNLAHSDPALWALVNENIAINSSAFEDANAIQSTQRVFIGSKTETAMLEMLLKYAIDYKHIRQTSKPIHVYPFSSSNKWMGTIIEATSDDQGDVARLHIKGASEIILAHCSSVYTQGIGPQPLTPTKLNEFQNIINSYANQSLRTIALAYMDIKKDQLPTDLVDNKPLVSSNQKREMVPKSPVGNKFDLNQSETGTSLAQQLPTRETAELNPDDKSKPESNHASWKSEYTKSWGTGGGSSNGLVIIGIVGIQDPLREGVTEAVSQCQRAGVFVRMVTGDNVATARAIAQKCGILNRGGLVMDGPTFRKLSVEAMEKLIPRLQVLARSSPTDKQMLVERLKEMGETVAVTGDGTNDGPALKLADVGFSMGIAGTEVAKEASSIILMDDNFASIVKAILWGRSVNDSVKKFLQFQLTVNLTAVLVTFVSAVSSDQQRSVLTAVQLLWVNLIMDSLAALALATEPPTMDMLERMPDSKSAPLITYRMWKMVIGQAIFQIMINLCALYIGPQVYTNNTASLNTFIFNTFIFLQIFNEINCRRLDNHLNTFSGIQKNPYFLVILLVTVILQIILVELGGSAFQTVPLSSGEWVTSILIGSLSIPVGMIVRLIPDWGYSPVVDERVVMSRERMQWIGAISTVQKQLKVFNVLRGSQRMANSGLRLSQPLARSETRMEETLIPNRSPSSSPTNENRFSPAVSPSKGKSGYGSSSNYSPISPATGAGGSPSRSTKNGYFSIGDD